MNKLYRKYIKRVLDIIFSGIALIVLSPVFLVVALLVRVKLGSPVIFTQDRPGMMKKTKGDVHFLSTSTKEDGSIASNSCSPQIFKIYKFRTMTDAKDENGNLLSDEVRLTDFGKMLRATSLDELPEIWNILKGDMSIIGPRPLLVQYLPRYSQEQARRHEVRPGLTGWAQINGRNAISWEEKFAFDVWYVDNISFILDVKIFFMTIGKVFSKKGINSDDHATMSEFGGGGNK